MSSYLKDKLDLKLDFNPRRTQSASAVTDRPVNGQAQSPKEQKAAEEIAVKSADTKKVVVIIFLKHEGTVKTQTQIRLSCVMRNKAADQLGSNCIADQRLCFPYIDSTTPLLPKSKIYSL